MLTDEEHRALRQLAAARQQSLSTLIRQILLSDNEVRELLSFLPTAALMDSSIALSRDD
jgi:hypothetical protein